MEKRFEACPSRSPESDVRCELPWGHEESSHRGPHPKGYLGWTVSWPRLEPQAQESAVLTPLMGHRQWGLR